MAKTKKRNEAVEESAERESTTEQAQRIVHSNVGPYANLKSAGGGRVMQISEPLDKEDEDEEKKG